MKKDISVVDKKDRPYTVEAYNPEWVTRFNEEERIIKTVFGDKASRIEHVGSTSVEGLWAKPQIDIVVIVESLDIVPPLVDQMRVEGYLYHGDYSNIGEEYFTRDAVSGERLVSIHVFTPDNPQALSQVYFRDYLRLHPADRDLYADTKKEAWGGGTVDRVTYAAKKKEVLVGLLARAKEWYEKGFVIKN